MCVPKDDEYVVPDYIFVHKDYSFSNPIKPLLMVETKNPVIIKDETFYQKLSDFVDANKVSFLQKLEHVSEREENEAMVLEDVCELIADCPHTTAPDEGKGYPLIRTPNVGKGRLLLEGVHRVSKDIYDKTKINEWRNRGVNC